MKYYLVCDNGGGSHIVVAEDIKNARRIAGESVKVEDIYELRPETFKHEGFLLSAK